MADEISLEIAENKHSAHSHKCSECGFWEECLDDETCDGTEKWIDQCCDCWSESNPGEVEKLLVVEV